MKKQLFFYFLVLLFPTLLCAQNSYPVHCQTVLSPQYSLSWGELTSSPGLRVQLRLRDQQESRVQVFLRFSLERVGLVIQSKADYKGTVPIDLPFGLPVILTGADLRELFHPDHVEVQSADQSFSIASLYQGGRLPFGLYTLKVTAYEFDPIRGHRQVSNTGTALMTAFEGYPPVLNYPINDHSMLVRSIENILFGWTPRGTALQTGGQALVYDFELYEIAPGQNPNWVVGNSQPVFTTLTDRPSLAYGQGYGHPQLVPGKRYAWRVRVRDTAGLNSYQNKGYSNVGTFYYGMPCYKVEQMNTEPQGDYGYLITWHQVPAADGYELQYKTPTDAAWTDTQAKKLVGQQDSYLFHKPQINEGYVFRLRATCYGTVASEWEYDIGPSPGELRREARRRAKERQADDEGSETAPEVPFQVLNPWGIAVNSEGISEDDQAYKDKETELAELPNETRCGMSIDNTIDCDPPDTVNPTGSIAFTFGKGKEFYVGGYKVTVVSGDAAEGRGLLFYPWFGKCIPVYWQKITVVEGEKEKKKEYGCLSDGEVKAIGGKENALTMDYKQAVATLLSSGPGAFVGNLKEALEEMTKIADSLHTGTLKSHAYAKVVTESAQNGLEEWTQKIGSYIAEADDILKPELEAIKSEIEALKATLNAPKNCFASNVPAKTNTGGQKASPQFFVEDCAGHAELLASVSAKVDKLVGDLHAAIGFPVHVQDSDFETQPCGDGTGNAAFMGDKTFQSLNVMKTSGDQGTVRIVDGSGNMLERMNARFFGEGSARDLHFVYQGESYWRINGVMVHAGKLSGVGCFSYLDEATGDWKLFKPAGYPEESMDDVVAAWRPGMMQFATFLEQSTISIAGLALGGPLTTMGLRGFISWLAVDGLMIAIEVERQEILSMDGGPAFLEAYDALSIALVAYQAGKLGQAGLEGVFNRFELQAPKFANTKFGKYVERIRAKYKAVVGRHPNWVEVTGIAQKVEDLTPHVLKVETNASGAFIPINVTRNGTTFNIEGFKGCHTENALKEYVQVNGGTYAIKNKSVGVGGVYEGQPVIYLNNKEYVKINGQFVEYEAGKLGGTSSFFPENWSTAKIKEEAEFAIANNHGAVSVDKPTELFGFSKDGTVEIHFYYNADGTIGSYFPKKR